MSTSFPQAQQKFKQFLDISVTDAPMISEYQYYLQQGNLTEANRALKAIPRYTQKIITAEDLNTIVDTASALQQYYLDQYSPAYIVSKTQPVSQQPTDFWFKIIE